MKKGIVMGKTGKDFKKRLRQGEKLFGTHISLSDNSVSEIVGNHGFDYVWIDSEHSALDYQELNSIIFTVQSKGVAALVRVPFVEVFLAKRILEMDPDGIIFPMTNTREEVQEAMDICLYPPVGKRGFGPVRAMDYGLRPLMEYVNSIDDELCKYVQIEQREAYENLDDILSVAYLDGVILGPMDLSFSMGYPGEVYSDQSLLTYKTIVEKASAKGVPVGMSVANMDSDHLSFWKDTGVQIITSGGDTAFINQGAATLIKTLKSVFA